MKSWLLCVALGAVLTYSALDKLHDSPVKFLNYNANASLNLPTSGEVINPTEGSLATICLDGISYYYYTNGNLSGMSPKISKDTLLPELCEV